MLTDEVVWKRVHRLLAVASLAVWVADASAADAAPLSLADAVRQGLLANLDLRARQRQLAADREEIDIARAALLPQITTGARAQIIDDERADGARGNNEEKSILLAARLDQVLYDEESWASFQIQQHAYQVRVREDDAFRLGTAQEVASAFLALDQARRILAIQQRDRELTVANRETSRSRIAAGWSSDREVLRWDVELATADQNIRLAEVDLLQNRLALNRLRNRPAEEATGIREVEIDEYGFVYARPAIADAITTTAGDRRMRDWLVRMGLRLSPEIAAFDASIAAAERQLTSSRRAFYVPTLAARAEVDYLTNQNSGEDFNETEWSVKGLLTFPIFEGGRRFASLTQAREALSSLRVGKRATAQTLEQSIRAALARSTGSFEVVGFARRRAQAARRNFDLVDASYRLGVASILDLLDAQTQLLQADLDRVRALYRFLGDLMAAERAIAYFPFLEAPGDVEALLLQLERELASPTAP